MLRSAHEFIKGKFEALKSEKAGLQLRCCSAEQQLSELQLQLAAAKEELEEERARREAAAQALDAERGCREAEVRQERERLQESRR